MKYVALILTVVLSAATVVAHGAECAELETFKVGQSVANLDTLETGAVLSCNMDTDGKVSYEVSVKGETVVLSANRVARVEFQEPDLSDIEDFLASR